MAKHMNGKKSAPAIRQRLQRLAQFIGEQKIRDVMREKIIAALERVALGPAIDGRLSAPKTTAELHPQKRSKMNHGPTISNRPKIDINSKVRYFLSPQHDV